MATTRISQLPALVEATEDDNLIINDANATTSRISVGAFRDSVQTSILEDSALTGTPTAPTAATGTDTTQVATTEYVRAEIAAELPTAYVTGVGNTNVPTTATDTGTPGEIRYGNDYLYICTATDVWKRVAISTWS